MRDRRIQKERVSSMTVSPGLIVLFGSGETSPSGRRVLDLVLQRLPQRPSISILETPAGFQPNSAAVAGQVAAFFEQHLRNYGPRTTVVPARKRNTQFSPDDPTIAESLRTADAIFMGPGSPTYAVRQLHDSLIWRMLQARHRCGATVIFASAATIAAGAAVLPVYEIYKVGDDLHWQQGLNFFAPFGLDLALVPHWNNQEGGAELDTSCCFMGRARFAELQSLLPQQTVVIGIDEHTALILDLENGVGYVHGAGSVTLLQGDQRILIASGSTFALAQLGPFSLPADLTEGLPSEILAALSAPAPPSASEQTPPPAVLCLLDAREAARQRRDWNTADGLRAEVMKLGWEIHDTPVGPKLASIHQS